MTEPDFTPAFTEEYATPEAYIIGITDRIWEQRGIGLIRRYYTPDVVMHTGLGDSTGVESVVRGTLETLHSFPDRRLLGEDVICGEAGGGAVYSSHRIASTMHHRGDGVFGPPTLRPVAVRTVADCLIRDGQICEEWLVRDQSAIALQLGLDPKTVGAEQAARLRAAGTVPSTHPAVPSGDTQGRTEEPAAHWTSLLHSLFDEAMLSAIPAHFDPAVQLFLPGGRTAAGHAELDAFIVGLMASFPDGRISVDHAIARDDPQRPRRVALRWRLTGTHSGHGAFGAPSGASVALLGITHFEIVGSKVIRAFFLLDELAVWTAIALHRG